MKIKQFVAVTLIGMSIAGVLLPTAALAQSFPQSDNFVSYSPWESYVSVQGGEVRTDEEGYWSSLRVTYEDGVTFSFSFNHNDGNAEGVYRSLFNTELSSRVVLVVDGQELPASSASMWGANGDVGIDFSFTDEAADCAAVEALSNAHVIQVRFPDLGEGGANELTGKGSSDALSGVCA